MENNEKRGLFIAFEGIDGAGKTTQINKLKEYLEGLGRRVFVTAEPTTYPTGVAIREALSGKTRCSESEMAAMFVLDRIVHNTESESGIERMLADGYDVLCDRYYYSSLAYQGSATDFEWVRAMNLSCPEIRVPDMCIFLDLTPEQSLERINARGESKEIYETEEKLTAVRNKFFAAFALLEKDEKIAIVSAKGEIDEVAHRVRARISELL